MSTARAIAPGEYYHVFNRGAHRFGIYKGKTDYLRFLFLILYSQSALTFPQIGRIARSGSVSKGFVVPLETEEKIISERFVELTVFALMPNHFHLLLKAGTQEGVARYMHRIETAYTLYFNTKYEGSGHVFQGRYKAIHVKDDRQLMYLSAYIHRNPRELQVWKGKEFEYPWSSLQDYTGANRWGGLLATDIIASRFNATQKSNYADFVKTSPAKLLKEEFKS